MAARFIRTNRGYLNVDLLKSIEWSEDDRYIVEDADGNTYNVRSSEMDLEGLENPTIIVPAAPGLTALVLSDPYDGRGDVDDLSDIWVHEEPILAWKYEYNSYMLPVFLEKLDSSERAYWKQEDMYVALECSGPRFSDLEEAKKFLRKETKDDADRRKARIEKLREERRKREAT